ncbi:SMI1/KNR4 family protein [Sphingomonas sp. ERG5]|uniref:SMI1/KNR4 family protein n=1 Tax=Sphingomonas sp. ERG5 TaxID=1381597 RepID=UPI000691C32E|nr:SMI1/KNR4 family protein [Sphingomonas sp. ERG5]
MAMFAGYIEELRHVYADHDLRFCLSEPNTESVLAGAEARLGFALDPGLREAWKIADGGEHEVRVFLRPGFLTGYDFLSLASAEEARARMERRSAQYIDYVEETVRDHRIRDGWFHGGWVPFAAFGGSSLMLIQDHSPAEAGKVGQVIAFTHDPDEITYVAPDFETFLQLSLEAVRDDPEEFLEIF